MVIRSSSYFACHVLGNQLWYLYLYFHSVIVKKSECICFSPFQNKQLCSIAWFTCFCVFTSNTKLLCYIVLTMVKPDLFDINERAV